MSLSEFAMPNCAEYRRCHWCRQLSLCHPWDLDDEGHVLGIGRRAGWYCDPCWLWYEIEEENKQLRKDNEQLKKCSDQLRKSHAEDIAAAEYTIGQLQLTIDCLVQVAAGPADQHAPLAIENHPDHPDDAPNIVVGEQLNDDAGPQAIDVVSNISTNSDFPDD